MKIGQVTIIGWKQYTAETLLITWRGASLPGEGPKREAFKNIKTIDAAQKILAKRNKENIESAVWNGIYLKL